MDEGGLNMNELKSSLSGMMEEYLKFKESLGYKRKSYYYVLHMLDDFAIKHDYRRKDVMTKELSMKWLEMKPTENENGRRKRALVTNDFSKFLRSMGHNSFVLPPGSFGRYVKPVPYIYTDEELLEIFKAFDNDDNPRWLPTLPVLMRFYFTTGVKPREPIELRKDDVDLKTGACLIKDSKGHKDRLIAFSDDLTDLLRKYDTEMDVLFPNRQYFFIYKGCKIQLSTLRDEFHRCFDTTHIESNGRKRPRLYDWRHNFASRSLQMMLEDDKDFDSLMVVLSEYMGHVEFRDTYYYISILPANLIHTGKLDWAGMPEVPYEN